MSSVILTSYFSKKIHPNDPNDPAVIGRSHDGRVLQNDFKYIQPWYESVNKLGLEGRIFCDNLSEDFISKFTTDKIKFINVEVSEYSNNDWRFFCYKKFLEENKFDNVFLTDGSDVTIVKDPSAIFSDYKNIDFFVCKDSIKLKDFPYITVHEKSDWDLLSYFLICQNHWDLINMGAIGASYKNIILFLEKFCKTRIELGNPDFNSDMWIGQYVFRLLLSDKNLLIGEPFTSEFKKYQIDRKDVYLIHK